MDLRVLFLVLWRKKWILILVPFFCVCCALTIRLLGEWQFKSTAQLATGLTLSDELIDNSKLNAYEVQVTFDNLIAIIKSRSVLDQVSHRLIEHDLSNSIGSFRKLNGEKFKEEVTGGIPAYTPELKLILKEKIDNLSLLDANSPQEKILKTFIEAYGYDFESINENLIVRRVNQSDFIELTCFSENPNLSAFVTNTICTEFIRYYSSVKMNRGNLSMSSLEEIAKQRKEYLDKKREELNTFKSDNNVINSAIESEDKIRQIRELEEQISDERQNIRGSEVTLANLNVRIEDAEAISSNRTNDQIVTLRRQINDLNEKYIQDGQNNKIILDSLTSLRDRLNVILRKSKDSPKLSTAELNLLRERREETRVALEIGRMNLNSLLNRYNSARYGMGNLADKEAKIRALEKELEVAVQEYLDAQNRYNEAREKLVTGNMSITQILMAEPAEKPESRKTLLFMMFSAVLGFIVSSFSIIVIELSDPRIKTTQRFKHLTRMKLAGIMPKLRKPILNANMLLAEGDNQMQKRINEELRKIRYEIDGYRARVLLVTSLKSGQGKSIFILALAFSLSLLKKRTLIIDTNLRNNSLSRIMLAKENLNLLLNRHPNGKKLLGARVQQEEEGTENPPFDYNLISRTQNDFIDIIGNKKSQLSPSEVLPTNSFNVLLEWLKEDYDYIILEGPALNLFSDSKELVKFTDLVIPIFSADSKIESEDSEALGFLRSLQTQLGPAVLNNVQQRQ